MLCHIASKLLAFSENCKSFENALKFQLNLKLLIFSRLCLKKLLKGDQVSNIQRLIDLGSGISERARNLWIGGLAASIKEMEDNLEK